MAATIKLNSSYTWAYLLADPYAMVSVMMVGDDLSEWYYSEFDFGWQIWDWGTLVGVPFHHVHFVSCNKQEWWANSYQLIWYVLCQPYSTSFASGQANSALGYHCNMIITFTPSQGFGYLIYSVLEILQGLWLWHVIAQHNVSIVFSWNQSSSSISCHRSWYGSWC